MERGTYERILAVAARLAATNDLPAVLGEIIDALRDLLDAERASVFQVTRGASGEPVSFFATRAHGLPGDLELPLDRGVIGEAASSRRVVVVHDAPSHPAFNSEVDRATGFVTRQILAVPLIDDAGRLVGVAQVLNKRGGSSFTQADERAAGHLALQAALAIRRADLLVIERERARLLADEHAAHAIQAATLPGNGASAPADGPPGWRIEGAWRPADRAAGDAWGIVDRPGGASRVVMLADATGHGVGAALSVSRVSAMLAMGVRAGLQLAEAARAINTLLTEELPTGLFVTAFFAEVRADDDGLSYVSAGQAPLALLRASGATETLGPTAPPLGIERWSDEDGVVSRLTIDSGERFIVASDGVYDALAPGLGFAEGVERLGEVARVRNPDDGCASEAAALLEVSGDAASDDRTVVVIARA